MAEGKPVGRAYGVLDLDTTKFEQGLKRTSDMLISGAVKTEDAYKILGTHSADTFDKMRKNAELAVTAILAKQKETLQKNMDMTREQYMAMGAEEVRIRKAAADKIAQINEQQYGKQSALAAGAASEQTSLISTLKSHWIAASVAIYAAQAAVTKAWNMAKVGAEFDEQSGILDNLATKYGTTADAIVEAMDRASDNQIAKSELMKIALGGIAKGLSPKQLTDLADAAIILGDAVGVSATVALKDLSEALESGRVKSLKPYLGTSLDLATAFDGLDAKMTQAEKSQGMYSLVMIKNAELQAEQTKAVDKGSDSMAQIEKKFDDATLAASRFAKTVAVGLIDGFKATFLSGNDAGETLTNFGTATEKATTATNAEAEAVKKLAAPYQAQIDALKKQLKARKDNEQAVKDAVAEAKKEAEYFKQLEAESLKQYFQGIDDKESADIKFGQDEAKRRKDEYDLYDKLEEESLKAWFKSIDDKEEADIKAGQDEANRLTTLLAARRAAEREIYKDLRGYEDQYFDATSDILLEQYDKYLDLGVKKEAVDAWATAEAIKNLIKQGIASDDFIDGVNAGFLEMQNNAMTFGKAGYEIFKTFTDSSKTALSTVLFDSIKTGAFDAQAVWTTFTDSMLKKFTDTISQMVIEAAASEILMMFKGEWTADSSSILGIINKGWDLWNSVSGGSGGNIDSGDQIDLGGGIEGRAGGGAVGGKPVWVGEQGKELLFPGGPGYVMEHNQSMAYSARNGGFIPGYATGGMIPPPGTTSRVDPFTAAMYASTNDSGVTSLGGFRLYGGPGGEYFDQQEAMTGTPSPKFAWAQMQIGDNLKRIFYYDGSYADSEMQTSAGRLGTMGDIVKIIDLAILSYATAGAASAVGGGLAGAAVGAGMGGATGWVASGGDAKAAAMGAVLGGIGGYNASAGGTLSLLDAAETIGTNVAKKWAIGQALEYIGNAINGGSGGSAGYSFAGASGDLSGLGAAMGGIAPRSDSFGFSARDGLDYVPYDNFPARLHKGERVQTADEARGGISLDIEIPVILDGREIGRASARQVISGSELTAAIDRRIKVMVQ